MSSKDNKPKRRGRSKNAYRHVSRLFDQGKRQPRQLNKNDKKDDEEGLNVYVKYFLLFVVLGSSVFGLLRLLF